MERDAWPVSLFAWEGHCDRTQHVLVIGKSEMFKALHEQHALSDRFITVMLTRNIRYEEALVDQLLNSSEKRLAKILLLLARFGKNGVPDLVIPKISQETLAEMVGTTRSRVNMFMNKFESDRYARKGGSPESSAVACVVSCAILGVAKVTQHTS